MEDMSTSYWVLIGAIALAINLVILFYLIRGANKTNRKHTLLTGQKELLRQQTRLLAELLKHEGVPEQRIIDILNPAKPYFLSPSK
jgi:hypothetical protein